MQANEKQPTTAESVEGMGPYPHNESTNGLMSRNLTHARGMSHVKVQKTAMDLHHRHGAHDRDSLAILM